MVAKPLHYCTIDIDYILFDLQVVTEGRTKFPRNCISGTSIWEDVDMGDCLRVLEIYPDDTKDSLQRQRFHSESPLRFLKGTMGEGDNTLANYFWAGI